MLHYPGLRAVLLAVLTSLLLSGCAVVELLDAVALNPTKHREATGVRPSTLKLHRTLLVADLHADTLMLDRGGMKGIQQRHRYGHADVPRWREGNVGLQVLTVATVTPVPYSEPLNGGWILPNAQWVLAPLQGWPPRTWWNSRQHALHQAYKWRVNADGQALTAIRTREDLAAFLSANYRNTRAGWIPKSPSTQPVATVLGLEGSHALRLHYLDSDTQIATRVKEFRDAGFRMLALTHRFDNELAGASEGSRRCGVTPLGHRLLREMERQQMICDLAHASSRTISEVLETYPDLPVMVSHGGIAFDACKGDEAASRLLSVDQARAIAKRGGIIGIGLWPEVLGEAEPELAAQMIKRCLADPCIGPQHVALGSDMDGSVLAAFAANNWCMLTEELRDLPEGTLRDVMGGNVIRFFQKHLP
ncbi:microsomal dipeptidase-like Zn-dependent dipeptidase [Roseimicrobium gellanilyticum]|uniref:Microsomal dipeptidase-like Zn-dependent dipeptidase n=1 Tax=Roseimicrobium gellanilyticum TaxID=748857 RepID=A0A366HPZ6_9BACT|nr:membrane dipeptidase [Roseimicrobium gellanilyticum]RBP45720.1 microsomal dipeptidase-like Zn-dependent dipeptidase [Roseimicrobium gellanilyticum]